MSSPYIVALRITRLVRLYTVNNLVVDINFNDL